MVWLNAMEEHERGIRETALNSERREMENEGVCTCVHCVCVKKTENTVLHTIIIHIAFELTSKKYLS